MRRRVLVLLVLAAAIGVVAVVAVDPPSTELAVPASPPPAREAPEKPPPAGPRSNDPPQRPNRNFQLKCPNSHNLIAVSGDPRPETNDQKPMLPQCTQLCNLQIAGLGKEPEDVSRRSTRRSSVP